MNQTESNEIKHKYVESPIISLLNEGNEAFENRSLMRLIRRDFELVVVARKDGYSWDVIACRYGLEGQAAQARYAFFYEKRRRAKQEKEVVQKGESIKPVPVQKKDSVPVKKETKEVKYASEIDISLID